MPPARPFSCLECSRAFTRNENLERHKRTHHDGANIPRFECHKCHAQFARKDVCKRHSANCANRPALSPVEGQAPSQTAAEKQVVSAGAEANIDMNCVQDDGFAIQMEDISRQFEWPVDTDGVLGPAGWPSPGSDTHNLPAEVTIVHIQSYIAHFHPSLPIIHLPTMRTQPLPPILSKAIVAIGCLYSTSKGRSRDSGAEGRLSQDLWQSGCSELETFVKGNRRRLRTTWVLQSWILYIVYGTFTGDEKRITKAREMYRFMTDAIREFEMLHKKSIFPPGSTWDADLGLSIPSAEVHRRWQLFIDQESVKLSLYAFYYLDYHLFASFNMRPMISSIEFEWDLPLAASLWEAESASEWWHTILQRQLHLESSRNDLSIPDDEAQIKSVMAATQFLLSKTASPRLLLALASSPFATLCIVANIENLVRDFTRCYYQLPPALADPSPFHVLTQVQNAQVSTALVLILSIVTENVCNSCDSKCTSLWHAVRMGCLSIRISLCKPDDLLVGGIIEGNPAAGLATSVHLSLGNHVSTRRSGSNRQRRKPIAEDGFVAILEDMLQAMHEMGTATIPQPWEAPWTTIQGFKILIILWQALRFSIAELQSQDSPTPSLDKYTKIYDPARIVVHAIITALDIYDPEEQHISHDSLSTLEGLDEVDDLETQFINWMKKICDRRDVWTIGHDMGQLLDEIRAMEVSPGN